ncbi:hypothetical protein CPLU01_09536 [Colletotrichum plurivorum]|uniref:Uncharacterized protein n=1 Tax=Colletotrichum plurivorum TaxID=2175906 RepID=A0A8H6NBQ1_9PEZI|nr:hypothetical protein CPLU01_09536 [Colletotrichum plurivorum]
MHLEQANTPDAAGDTGHGLSQTETSVERQGCRPSNHLRCSYLAGSGLGVWSAATAKAEMLDLSLGDGGSTKPAKFVGWNLS